MKQGIIVRGYAGFYYVQAEDGLWECSLRGKFRYLKQNVLVGDRVKIRPLEEGKKKAVIEEILPRCNELLRPPIANVDQAVIVMALKNPNPSLYLLDRLLVLAEISSIEPVIVFNKIDLVAEEAVRKITEVYQRAGYSTVSTSAVSGAGVEVLREFLKGKVSVFAGPSGVGKSSLLNALQPGLSLHTGEVSSKIGRGRHTTRRVELLVLESGGWVADTPGFSVIDLPPMPREELAYCFREFREELGRCRFTSCLHRGEQGCAIMEAVRTGRISSDRYWHYREFLEEVIENERRY